ncbi:MAG: DUF4258 domain-containing protein [Candidatus Binataceae bacterium]
MAEFELGVEYRRMAAPEVIFNVTTPLGFSVRCSRTYWNFIVTQKPPVLLGHDTEVKEALSDPDQIRRSRKDRGVFLFYRGASPRWLCAAARRENGEGFLITAYPTGAIKAGEQIWTKSK